MPSPSDAPADAPESLQPRWRVLLTSDLKTLFHLIQDDRLEIQRAYDPARPPHLIVLACPKLDGGFAEAARALPPQAWSHAVVVLDASGKGSESSGKFVRRLQAFLAERAVPETRCALVTNNRRLTLKGSGVRVLHYDYWLRKMYQASPEQAAKDFKRRLRRFRARPSVRARRFLSFNFTARRWKLMFLLSLLRDRLWDQGFISFGGFARLELSRGGSLKTAAADLLAAEGAADLAAELLPYLPQLDAKGQVLFGRIPQTQDGVLRKATKAGRVLEFEDSWFSATTETEMTATVDCVTEKSFKAPLNFHPQVIMGNPGAMARLRAFGFQSFSPFIDETYDQETDPRRRFELAYAEIRRLCALDEADLARMERELSPVLIANARWGVIGLREQYRRTIDPELVSSLLALCPREAASSIAL